MNRQQELRWARRKKARGGDPSLREVATLHNLERLDLISLLEMLEPYLLEDIPEGVLAASEGDLHEIDRQIGRLANTFSYVSSLYAYSCALVRNAKRESRTDDWHDAVAKKDALDKLRSALKLKWQACSRMVTVETEVDLFERPAYEKREARVRERESKGHMKGWGNVARAGNRTR